MYNISEKTISGIVKTFEGFAVFCRVRWRAVSMALFFIVLMVGIFLTTMFLLTKIKQMEKAFSIHYPTAEEMQFNLEKEVDNNSIIENNLEDLLKKRDADRAFLVKFHNSEIDISGKHFFYFSITNSVTKNGISRKGDEFQRVPIYVINNAIKSFLKGECMTIFPEEMNDDEPSKKMLTNESIIQFQACPMFDMNNGYLIGFVGVDWVNRISPEDNYTKGEIETIKITDRISGVLYNK